MGARTRFLMRLAMIAAQLVGATSFQSIRRTQYDGWTKSEELKDCQQLAPGVEYCGQKGKPGLDEVIDVRYKTPPLPNGCRASQKVKKSPPSVLLLHHVGMWGRSPNGPFTRFFEHEDFTIANATKMGKETLDAWDLAMDGLCEGEKVQITLPPSLGFDAPKARLARPSDVPVGATLQFEVEVVKVLFVSPDGHPYRPCFFSLIDTDGSGDLDELELARHFARVKQQTPPHVMNEDLDGDGRISFDEFTGPKIPREEQEAMALKDEL